MKKLILLSVALLGFISFTYSQSVYRSSLSCFAMGIPNDSLQIIGGQVLAGINPEDVVVSHGFFPIGDLILNVPNYQANYFEVYPNPFKSKIQINSDFTSQSVIDVYTVTGQLILRVDTDVFPFLIDLKSLENGIYFVKVFNQNNVMTVRKVIKQ